jgi:hypothetical protein
MANFICPMHPEISADRPGTCAKCGMKLEAREDRSTASERNRNKSKNEPER